MSHYTIKAVSHDEFGIFPGSGWVICERGKRIDWPMLSSREEALADVRDFRRSERQLAEDEASEICGLRLMGVA